MSTAPQRKRANRHKVTRRLRERCENKRAAPTRAIWHAQSDEKVAQAKSKWTRRHMGTDPTNTHTHKMTRRLRERYQNSTEPQRDSKNRRLKQHTSQFQYNSRFSESFRKKYCARQEKTEASEALQLPHKMISIISMYSKHCPSLANMTPPTKQHQALWYVITNLHSCNLWRRRRKLAEDLESEWLKKLLLNFALTVLTQDALHSLAKMCWNFSKVSTMGSPTWTKNPARLTSLDVFHFLVTRSVL